MRNWVLRSCLLLLGCGCPTFAEPPPGENGMTGEEREERSAIRASGMDLKIDHVTIAGSDLSKMRDAFASLGLVSEYGGAHSNGITHMALLGFEDGS